jgi:hypothetical protein
MACDELLLSSSACFGQIIEFTSEKMAITLNRT